MHDKESLMEEQLFPNPLHDPFSWQTGEFPACKGRKTKPYIGHSRYMIDA